jgi:hypothetical protein
MTDLDWAESDLCKNRAVGVANLLALRLNTFHYKQSWKLNQRFIDGQSQKVEILNKVYKLQDSTVLGSPCGYF